MLSTTGWAIISPLNREPWIVPIIKCTRAGAQEDMATRHGTTWKKLYRRGFRAIRVEVIPIYKKV